MENDESGGTRTSRSTFAELMEEAKQHDDFWLYLAQHDYTESLYALMKAEGVDERELARRVGTSASYVTKVFRGSVNPSLKQMIRLARGLEGELHMYVAGEGNIVDFKETGCEKVKKD